MRAAPAPTGCTHRCDRPRLALPRPGASPPAAPASAHWPDPPPAMRMPGTAASPWRVRRAPSLFRPCLFLSSSMPAPPGAMEGNRSQVPRRSATAQRHPTPTRLLVGCRCAVADLRLGAGFTQVDLVDHWYNSVFMDRCGTQFPIAELFRNGPGGGLLGWHVR